MLVLADVQTPGRTYPSGIVSLGIQLTPKGALNRDKRMDATLDKKLSSQRPEQKVDRQF